MPRDVNGVYSLPPGNPVVPNTIIATNWANTTMNDIATALTNSLSIDGSVTTAKLANSSVTTVKIADGNVTRTKLSTSLQNNIGGKNYFINGSFNIWQAGNLAMGTGNRYSADMVSNSSVGTTYSSTQTAWPVGQTDVDPRAVSYIRNAVISVAGASNFSNMQFTMEDVRTLAGKQVTVSFWAQCTTATQPISLELSQLFGAGGSATVRVNMGQKTITGAWQRFTATANVPSISGKTIGTMPHSLILTIWLDAGSDYNARTGSLGQRTGGWNFWGLKVEEGSEATPFVVEEYSTDYDRCCRFYWAPPLDGGASGGPICWSGDVGALSAYHTVATFPTKMAYVPSVTCVEGTSTGFAATPATPSSTTTVACRVFKTATAIGAARIYSGTLIADARL